MFLYDFNFLECEDAVIKVLEPYEMIMMNKVEETEPEVEAKKKFKCLYKGCEKSYSTSQHLTVSSIWL